MSGQIGVVKVLIPGPRIQSWRRWTRPHAQGASGAVDQGRLPGGGDLERVGAWAVGKAGRVTTKPDGLMTNWSV